MCTHEGENICILHSHLSISSNSDNYCESYQNPHGDMHKLWETNKPNKKTQQNQTKQT